MIDTHAHLDFPEFAGDLPEVLKRAEQAGVTRIIAVGTDVQGSRDVVALAEKYPQVYAVVGVHPNSAIDAGPNTYDELKALAQHPKVVAIGETGLDYYRLPSETATPLAALGNEPMGNVEASVKAGAIKTAQEELFLQQLDLAKELGLNVVIHQRGDCRAETLRLLAPYTDHLRAVFHCFGGTVEEAEELFKLGHLVSFTGIVTFKNAAVVQETAARIPDGTFMVETDAPFLAPVPFRGKRCEPAFTRETAAKIATLRGTTLEAIDHQTTETAESFFRFRKV